MKKFLIALVLLPMLAMQAASAKSYTLTSPNGKLEVKVDVAAQTSYTLAVSGKQILAPSRIAMELDIGRALGMDGTILAAFILGIPANEIVLPIALMAYAAEGSMSEISVTAAREILLANGWDTLRAVSVMIFSLCHFPCSTTLITIKRETGSLRYTVLAALLPTALGVILCGAVNLVAGLFM